jgi:hypothetical protein
MYQSSPVEVVLKMTLVAFIYSNTCHTLLLIILYFGTGVVISENWNCPIYWSSPLAKLGGYYQSNWPNMSSNSEF